MIARGGLSAWRQAALAAIVLAAFAFGPLSPVPAFAAGHPAKAPAGHASKGNPATTPAGQVLSPGFQGPGAAATPVAPTSTQPQQIPAAPVATSASNAGGSINGTDALILAFGAAIVLLIVAYFILRDSRHHARRLRHASAAGGDSGGAHRGSKAPHRSRKLSAAERKRRKRGRARAR